MANLPSKAGYGTTKPARPDGYPGAHGEGGSRLQESKREFKFYNAFGLPTGRQARTIVALTRISQPSRSHLRSSALLGTTEAVSEPRQHVWRPVKACTAPTEERTSK
ncbi:unnamed protein product [Protopolystoma xenopodis]|uniref:Uncharacterized protein n=1 Tax=Protopolystoma xenopodis TaxID=117903 RepID=A0A3S4ZYA7_9PLAT|nr:unnamed protein product [Protopolystoma xenopodis]